MKGPNYKWESRPIFSGPFSASVEGIITRKSRKARTFYRLVEFRFDYPPFGTYWFVVDDRERKILPKLLIGQSIRFCGSIFPIKSNEPHAWSKFKEVPKKDLHKEQYWKVARINGKGQQQFLQGTFRGTPEEVQALFGFDPIHFEISKFGRLDPEKWVKLLFYRVFPEPEKGEI
jgi:hypothetical protein